MRVKREITATEVMIEMGYKNPSRHNVTECGKFLRELSPKWRILDGKSLYKIPYPKIRPTII